MMSHNVFNLEIHSEVVPAYVAQADGEAILRLREVEDVVIGWALRKRSREVENPQGVDTDMELDSARYLLSTEGHSILLAWHNSEAATPEAIDHIRVFIEELTKFDAERQERPETQALALVLISPHVPPHTSTPTLILTHTLALAPCRYV